MASNYPTKWKRTTMRGCHPKCKRMDLPVESRTAEPGRLETRHVAPAGHLPPWLEACTDG